MQNKQNQLLNCMPSNCLPDTLEHWAYILLFEICQTIKYSLMSCDNWVKFNLNWVRKREKECEIERAIWRRQRHCWFLRGETNESAKYFNLCENIVQTNKSAITNNKYKNKYCTFYIDMPHTHTLTHSHTRTDR